MGLKKYYHASNEKIKDLESILNQKRFKVFCFLFFFN